MKTEQSLEKLYYEEIASVNIAGEYPNAWIWGYDIRGKQWVLAHDKLTMKFVLASRTPEGKKEYIENDTRAKQIVRTIKIKIYRAKKLTYILDQEYASAMGREFISDEDKVKDIIDFDLF